MRSGWPGKRSWSCAWPALTVDDDAPIKRIAQHNSVASWVEQRISVATSTPGARTDDFIAQQLPREKKMTQMIRSNVSVSAGIPCVATGIRLLRAALSESFVPATVAARDAHHTGAVDENRHATTSSCPFCILGDIFGETFDRFAVIEVEASAGAGAPRPLL